MQKFLQNKLWRDKSIEIMESQGSKVHWRVLDDDNAFIEQLRKKLIEEAYEVASAKNRNELVEELADLFEVIDTLITISQLDKNQIYDAQKTKREERGSFYARRFVETAEHPTGSFGYQHCQSDPKKYPKIS